MLKRKKVVVKAAAASNGFGRLLGRLLFGGRGGAFDGAMASSDINGF